MLSLDQHPANPEWAAAKVAGMPRRWQGRLLRGWDKRRNAYNADVLGQEGDATRDAAYWLADRLEGLRTTSLPLDAGDGDIVARAEQLAGDCMAMQSQCLYGEAVLVSAGVDTAGAQGMRGHFNDSTALRAAMVGICRANHVEPPAGKKMTDQGAIARMVCPQWWRRQLRKVQAAAVEAGAISIGYVNRTADIYVSNESLTRRVQQNKRNAAMLEATKARNEDGQEFTLAELSAKGVSNKAIKRGELMTRIAGFERIARECDHEGLFFTITCPSRMHKWRTVKGGRVIENRRYDHTQPDEAQRYLSKVWARIRAALARAGFRWYGFRIAEPNHDGTPHWHVLVFFDRTWPGAGGCAAMPRVAAVIRSYALMDSPTERGAKKHRVDFEKIDWNKGSAAAYIAKYVSKNIDGYGVGEDLYGNPTFETCHRVEAWAATWRIRQFQQIGGAPVTVWREMRRVKELPADAPAHVEQAHRACNKVAPMEGAGQDGASVAWDMYIKAQGGVFCGRDYKIKLQLEDLGGVGRYGEALPPRPVGLTTVVAQPYRDGIVFGTRYLDWVVKSARHVWEIIVRGAGKAKAGIARAWTRVNNCTRSDFTELAEKFTRKMTVRESLDAIYNSDFYGPVRDHQQEFCGPWNVPELEKAMKEMQ